MLAFFQVGLEVHLEKGWAAGVVGAAHRPVVTTTLVVLPGTKLDGEGAAPWVYLKDTGLPSACCTAAMPTMYEELSNLLSYCNVVYHHCQLGIVHRTLL